MLFHATQSSDFKPIAYKTKPDQELIIQSFLILATSKWFSNYGISYRTLDHVTIIGGDTYICNRCDFFFVHERIFFFHKKERRGKEISFVICIL